MMTAGSLGRADCRVPMITRLLSQSCGPAGAVTFRTDMAYRLGWRVSSVMTWLRIERIAPSSVCIS